MTEPEKLLDLAWKPKAELSFPVVLPFNAPTPSDVFL